MKKARKAVPGTRFRGAAALAGPRVPADFAGFAVFVVFAAVGAALGPARGTPMASTLRTRMKNIE